MDDARGVLANGASLKLTRVVDFGDGSLGIVDFPLMPQDGEARVARVFYGEAAYGRYLVAITTLGFVPEPVPPRPPDIDEKQWPICMVVRTVSGRLISFGTQRHDV